MNAGVFKTSALLLLASLLDAAPLMPVNPVHTRAHNGILCSLLTLRVTSFAMLSWLAACRH